MPRMDMTGPMGAGPMTGRGLGPCGGGQAFGCGRGRGAGMGRAMGNGQNVGQGYGRGMAVNVNQNIEPRQTLQQRRDFLKTQLDALDKELQSE